MKSLAELSAIKEKKIKELGLDGKGEKTRILVGLATCGMAAGATQVFNTLKEEIEKSGKGNIVLSQTGCIGICQYEPVFEVFEPGKEKVTYVKMDDEKAKRVFAEHLIGGQVVKEYTIGA